MQQRQLRLGDILDDYCPRERRVTNHAIVAMVGQEVKQTRCTTCDSDHEYKHAKVPRQRRKAEAVPGVGAHPASAVPNRVVHHTLPQQAENPSSNDNEFDDDLPAQMPTGDAHPPETLAEAVSAKLAADERHEQLQADETGEGEHDEHDDDVEVDVPGNDVEGPVHRPLIRATLPRPEGQQPPQRPAPDFTIRQPGGRGRFRSRHQRGPQQFGNRGGNMGGGRMGNGNGNGRSMGAQGPLSRSQRRHGPPRKRQK